MKFSKIHNSKTIIGIEKIKNTSNWDFSSYLIINYPNFKNSKFFLMHILLCRTFWAKHKTCKSASLALEFTITRVHCIMKTKTCVTSFANHILVIDNFIKLNFALKLNTFSLNWFFACNFLNVNNVKKGVYALRKISSFRNFYNLLLKNSKNLSLTYFLFFRYLL